jgi:hypothetical protein
MELCDHGLSYMTCNRHFEHDRSKGHVHGGFAMCEHTDQPGYWHVACNEQGCPDHWAIDPNLSLIRCAYCNSTDHFPINCTQPVSPVRTKTPPDECGYCGARSHDITTCGYGAAFIS